MKKYNLILCALGSSILSPFAFDDVSHAEDRPRAARVDSKQTKENGGQAAQNKDAPVPAPTTEKTNTTAANRVRMGPTTVTVIDDGEAIDDVVSRVRQARIERLRQDEPKQEARVRRSDRNPEDRLRREPAIRMDKKVERRTDVKRSNESVEDRVDKAEVRGGRRDEATDKREERLDRIKEKREQRTQIDRPVRGGRSEK